MADYGSTAFLKAHYGERCDNRDWAQSIASHVIRVGDESVVAVGKDRKPEEQICGLLDALHWMQRVGTSGIEYRLYSGGRNDQLVRDAVATLHLLLPEKWRTSVRLMRDDAEFKPTAPDFSDAQTRWASLLENRKHDRLPELASILESRTKTTSFRWYRNIGGGPYSGRVDGLEVCTINPAHPDLVCFQVGKVGANGSVSGPKKRFEEIAGTPRAEFGKSTVSAAAELLDRLADDRKSGELGRSLREHMLESRVLSGELPLSVSSETLEPLVLRGAIPFQFPARFSLEDFRLIDALMRHKTTLWVLELKESAGGGQGQHYRHGIAQAALYSHFIRSAKALHFWFEEAGVDPTQCRAAVAFPTIRGPRAPSLLAEHRAIADLLGVQVTEISA